MENEYLECEVCGEEWPEDEMSLLNDEEDTYLCPNCGDFDSKF